MPLLSIQEIIDIIIMSLAIGFIFKDSFTSNIYEVYETGKSVFWHNMKIAMIAAAPAVILHEFGHKFVALGFGYTATFHAAYFWLFLGIMLKLLSFPFVFFVPAYVSHTAAALPWQSALIAFAGPAINLVLWLGSWLMLKTGKYKGNALIVLVFTKQINMFLFIFNMIPLGFFDGAQVLDGLLKTFF